MEEEGDRVTQNVNVISKKIRETVLSLKRVTKADAGMYMGYAHNMGNHNGVESHEARLQVIGIIICRN